MVWVWRGVFVLSVVLGCVYRFHLLGSAPEGVWFDEAVAGNVAKQILHDPTYRPIFIGGIAPIAALFYYVWAASVWLFGPTILAIRLVTTVAGIATLPFLYLLGCELFDRRVAAFATFFLAVMRWHVNFSRFGMHGIFMPLFMTAALYYLVRGLKGYGVGNFAVVGVMLGIGLQGYYSFFFVPLVLMVYLVHHTWSSRALSWRRLLAGSALCVLSTAIVYGPMAWFAYHHPEEFGSRLSTVSIMKGRTLEQVIDVAWVSTQQHAAMFLGAGDRNGRHNLPGAPMLDPVTGWLFVCGLAMCVWHWRDASHFLVLAWIVIVLQCGIWSLDFEAPQAYRTCGVTPAVALLAALPLAQLWKVVEREWA
jgi:4-amino-4-deoxy-L-arabinose transferase-like glycosyltransferase